MLNFACFAHINKNEPRLNPRFNPDLILTNSVTVVADYAKAE